ncbi:hypothetical protein GCM10010215_60570 [Streptomyces virginiae]|uniref:Secreted protein n=1 Tax=Streptomyces virginiae TaxID=1961 RepID=A0ABQ3NV80_STRVG|nr:hypothetical protein GCM10010215_60570 [Streptomyces virginiae]GHI16677.1 hypothetical protein Scinn_61400 [Streptomyces virginiae]
MVPVATAAPIVGSLPSASMMAPPAAAPGVPRRAGCAPGRATGAAAHAPDPVKPVHTQGGNVAGGWQEPQKTKQESLGPETAGGLFCWREDPGNVAPGSFCAFSTLNEPRTVVSERTPGARDRQGTRRHVRSSTAHVLDGTEEEPT